MYNYYKVVPIISYYVAYISISLFILAYIFFLVADTNETLSLTQCNWVISARREDFTPRWLSPPFSVFAQESAVCQQQPSEGWGRSGRPDCFQWAEPWQKFYSTKIFVMSAPREQTGSVFLFKKWFFISLSSRGRGFCCLQTDCELINQWWYGSQCEICGSRAGVRQSREEKNWNPLNINELWSSAHSCYVAHNIIAICVTAKYSMCATGVGFSVITTSCWCHPSIKTGYINNLVMHFNFITLSKNSLLRFDL